MENVQARIASIKARQAQWMRERDSERLRESAEAELQAELGSVPDEEDLLSSPKSSGKDIAFERIGREYDDSGSNHKKQQLNPAAVMERITERLTDKLKFEIREELKREGDAQKNVERRRCAQLEGFLAKELETHTCPICYEMMSGEMRSPQLLFPCGHTFCEKCLKHHLDRERKSTCPFCRTRVESRAPNVSLQQLIQSYELKRREVTKKDSKSRTSIDHPANPDYDQSLSQSNTSSYGSRAAQIQVRIKILANEFEDNLKAIDNINERKAGINKVIALLSEERRGLTVTISSLQAELTIVDRHLSEQRTKMETVNVDDEELHLRQKLVNETILSLQNEYEKLSILDEGLKKQTMYHHS